MFQVAPMIMAGGEDDSSRATSENIKRSYMIQTPETKQPGVKNGLGNTRKSLRAILQLPLEASSRSLDRRPLVVGHRGCLYQHLENSLAGFQACADLGCDAVELDVFRLKDDTLVAFHGAGTDELGGSLANHIQDTESFNQKRNIQDLTWEEVQNECNFLQNSPCLPCPEEAIRHGRIPKLEQVLQMAKTSGLHLKIELKGPKTVEPTIDLIEGYDMVDQCSFASFRPDHVALVSQLEHERFQSQEPPKPCHYQRGLLFAGSLPEDFLQQALDVGATEVHLRYDTCTPKRVDRIHQAGLRSMAWFRGPVAMSQQEYADVGNEDAEMYETVMATGVNQICVNRPDIVLGILNNATK